jgi:hypothetical protein
MASAVGATHGDSRFASPRSALRMERVRSSSAMTRRQGMLVSVVLFFRFAFLGFGSGRIEHIR